MFYFAFNAYFQYFLFIICLLDLGQRQLTFVSEQLAKKIGKTIAFEADFSFIFAQNGFKSLTTSAKALQLSNLCDAVRVWLTFVPLRSHDGLSDGSENLGHSGGFIQASHHQRAT